MNLMSLQIKIKVYNCSFHPDRVRVWKIIFRAMNGLHFATLSWNLSSTKVWCRFQALMSFCWLCCPYSLSAGGIYPVLVVTKNWPFSTCTFKQSATVTSIPTGTGQSWRRDLPSSWCLDQFVVSSYALKCTCLVPAAGRASVWRAALLCTAFVSLNTTGCLERLSSVWPKQHLIVVNLSSH